MWLVKLSTSNIDKFRKLPMGKIIASATEVHEHWEVYYIIYQKILFPWLFLSLIFSSSVRPLTHIQGKKTKVISIKIMICLIYLAFSPLLIFWSCLQFIHLIAMIYSSHKWYKIRTFMSLHHQILCHSSRISWNEGFY